MCYPAVPWSSQYDSGKPSSGRRLFLVVTPPTTAVQESASQQVMVEGRNGSGGGIGSSNGGAVKQCVCSPTRHPGSFKCRQHHSEYEWVGRLGPKSR